MSAEAVIAGFAAEPPPVPASALAAAERLLCDTLKVGVAGAQSNEAQEVAALGAAGPCRLLAGGTASAADAAFANGYAIHCLEWDPVHEGAVVHALSVVTAALLAVSDRAGGSARADLLEAVAVGVEVAAGLGVAATGPMRFFRPATAGVIGAALACGRLLRLPADRFRGLLGLAYSFASGTMQAHVEGSSALPLQIAAAARSGVTAVELATCGFDGPQDALAGAFGYSKLLEPLDFDRWLPRQGKRWLIEEVSVKPWPCGRASHGLLAAIQASGISAADVRSVTAHVPPLVQRLVGRSPKPDMAPSHARLCGPFLAALMFQEGRIDPRRFTPADFANPRLLDLANRVTIDLDSNPDHNALAPQRFLFEDSGGRTDISVAANPGSPEAPMSPELAAARERLLGELAGPMAAELFDDPLAFACRPR